MRLHLCGVRGSTPAPGPEFARYGGHTSCVAIAHDGEVPTLVLDAGTGLRRVTGLLGGAPFVGTILLTHLHWDHVHGLPFFSGGDRTDARVRLLLPQQPDGSTPEAVLERGMSPPHFPIRPRELRGAWTFDGIEDGSVELEGFRIEVRDVPHKGGRTLGYRVSDGRATIAYIPDHCPTTFGPGPDGFGAYHPAALALVGGVDVSIHDAHLLPSELAAEAAFGHAAADYAVALAEVAGARRAVLFHHKPDRTDDELDALARRFGGAGVAVTAAAEQTVIDL